MTKQNRIDRKRVILHDFLALMILVAGILTILSLASFNLQDSSFFSTNPQKPVKNWVGIGGALWGSILLLGFGKASYLIGVVIFLFGWYILISKNKTEMVYHLTGLFILMITFSVLFSIKLSEQASTILIKNGGVVGLYLRTILGDYLGLTGLYIISFSLIMLSLMLLTSFSLKNIISGIKDGIKGFQKIGEFFKILFKGEIKDVGDEKPPLINKVTVSDNKEASSLKKGDIQSRVEITDYVQKKPLKIKAEKKKKLLLEEPKKEEDRTGDFKNYKTPDFNLLSISPDVDDKAEKQYIYQKADKLEETLLEFGVKAKVINIHKGPVITRYELQPAPGVKVNKIVNLADNIALSLAAQRVRIVAPIPGKAAVGVEIPNVKRHIVTLGDILQSKEYQKQYKLIEVPLGKDISGQLVKIDIKDCPHLLIAGATGSGKSVLLNSLICSMLYNIKPEEMRFIMIDPKMVELKIYNGIPHLMAEVITNPKHALIILKHLVDEMERRYELLDSVGTRDLDRYNEKIKKGRFSDFQNLPYIVVIIDEFADLMMVTAREIEALIVRLAQKARAVGIHLIIATQRPSVDVITGLIKANFPTRIAFQVASKIDSRTILDSIGADKLLGKGDMLVSFGHKPGLMRVQGAFISEDEVENIVNHINNYKLKLDYLDINSLIQQVETKETDTFEDEYDDMYFKAKDVVKETKKASASFLQRRLKIGFNRAARYIDMMEEEGLIGPPVGSKPREVYMDE